MDDMRLDPKLPDGAVVNEQILITSYFDPNGKLMFAVTATGDVNLAQALGLVMLGAINVYESYTQGDDEP